MNIHDVRIGKKLAHEMTLAELHKLVKELGVPRIKPDMGMQDTIFFLGVHQLEELERERDSAA